ncbi:MAG: ATP-dependent DNA helicase RecG [Pseudomonadota bacterium]
MPDTATMPLNRLKGVGPKVAEHLERLGLRVLQDLLFHLPLRYQDRTHITPLGDLRAGDEVVFQAEIRAAQIIYGKRRSLLLRVSDGSGFVQLRFFHFNQVQQQALVAGAYIRGFGEARRGPQGLEITHPEYRLIDPGQPLPVAERLTPIYPATEGLNQPLLRRLAEQALVRLHDPRYAPTELLPESILAQWHLLPLIEALQAVHQPPPDSALATLESGAHPALRRLAFEELLAFQLGLRQLRQRIRQHRAPALTAHDALCTRFVQTLPFTLTTAQLRVSAEVRADLALATPMLRLVQGDVGSGKTVVAALASLQAAASGVQTALMAPTELLSEQHFQTLQRWFAPLAVEVAWLGGRLKGKTRAALLARIAQGQATVVVGTHALFQDDIVFANLGLMIIDEQHRFGVHQRLALRAKGRLNQTPHQLVMTATPIPRTLAMTAYADLDVSVIDELPRGRQPIDTVAIPERRRDEVIQRIHTALREGRQAYWVCTLIDASEVLLAQAAEDTAAQLAAALPGLRVGLIHGRMKAADKEDAMARFKAGALQLLVATTVIEVGVDVPNASLMIIENAERLGLAQLHQLRGRVGRGEIKSTCVLLYRSPLSEQARARLSTLRETQDGFAIARRDLELRGPGEVLGTRQTGLVQFHIADLARDAALLPKVALAAESVLQHHPECVAPLLQRWVRQGQQYSEV